jgi:hypothetical protein
MNFIRRGAGGMETEGRSGECENSGLVAGERKITQRRRGR